MIVWRGRQSRMLETHALLTSANRQSNGNVLAAKLRGQLWWSRSRLAMRGIVVFLACARYALVKFDWRNFPCSPSRDSSEDEDDFKRVSLCVDYPDPAGVEIYLGVRGAYSPRFPSLLLHLLVQHCPDVATFTSELLLDVSDIVLEVLSTPREVREEDFYC